LIVNETERINIGLWIMGYGLKRIEIGDKRMRD